MSVFLSEFFSHVNRLSYSLHSRIQLSLRKLKLVIGRPIYWF